MGRPLDLGQFRLPNDTGALAPIGTTPGLEKKRLSVQPNKPYSFSYQTPAGTRINLMGLWADENSNGVYDDGDVLKLLRTRGDFDPEFTSHFQFSDGDYDARAEGKLVPKGVGKYAEPERPLILIPPDNGAGPKQILPPGFPPGFPKELIIPGQPPKQVTPEPDQTDPSAKVPPAPEPKEPVDPDGPPQPNRKRLRVAAMTAAMKEIEQLPPNAIAPNFAMAAPDWSLIVDPDGDGKTTMFTYDDATHEFTPVNDVAVDSLYLDGSALKQRREGEKDPTVYLPFVVGKRLTINGHTPMNSFDFEAIIPDENQRYVLLANLVKPVAETLGREAQDRMTASLFNSGTADQQTGLAKLLLMHRRKAPEFKSTLVGLSHAQSANDLSIQQAPYWKGDRQQFGLAEIEATLASLSARRAKNFDALDALDSAGKLTPKEAAVMADLRLIRKDLATTVGRDFIERYIANPSHYTLLACGDTTAIPAGTGTKAFARDIQGILQPFGSP